jgi:hypothetical protein
MTDVEPCDFREPVSLFDYDQSEVVFAVADPSTETVAQYQPPSVTEPEDTRDPITYDEKKGFWRRQFQPEPTPSQRVFDWGFGVAFPIFCFAADPFVFRGSLGGRAWLGEYMPFANTLAFVSIVAMIVWLAWGKHFKFAHAIFGGLFAVGGLISLVVGVALLPLSLLALIFLIGALGFTPLFTSVIYFRNSYRAFLTAEETVPRSLVYHTFFLVGILSFVIPYLINVNAGTWISPLRFIYRAYYGPMY